MNSGFLTPLRVEELDDTSHDGRGTWQLLVPLAYQSAILGRVLTVPAGFITDFASVPRWVPVAFALVGDSAHKAAVVHDWLYSSQETSRMLADAVLREAAQATHVPDWRAWMLWTGVRIGGASRWKAPNSPQLPSVAAILTAPTQLLEAA